MLVTLLYTLALFSSALSITLNNTIYLITNAEKPSLGRLGLSPEVWKEHRTAFPSVFENLNIGLIITCTPNITTNACVPANITAAPLAASLGLVPDTSCGTGDDADIDCVDDLLREYEAREYDAKSNQSVLIIWDSSDIDDLLDNLNLELPEGEDEDNLAIFADIILIKNRKQPLVEISMNCTAIGDGQAPGSF
ncbi:hypothetical protein B0H14DRAFT_3449983 [Mycena olivaceomarginata]|nr:hypothetical protein B0H14DRAFT_3449983 [Mycena olivaceomarginata]